MKHFFQLLDRKIFLLGAIIVASFFVSVSVQADTILLKNGKELKGLVVEKHVERIILSTEKGEIPILLSGIKDIQYDAPEQNFFKAGKSYEAENKLGQALAYYEKALEVNPNFEEARVASLAVRNRFWATAAEGPRNEIEKQQAVYDAWEKGGASAEEVIKKKEKEQLDLVKERLGIILEKKGDWIRINGIEPSKPAGVAGLRRNDRLVSLDGESLRYLNPDAVRKLLLMPRFSSFSLEYSRDYFINKTAAPIKMSALGIKFKLQYQGIIVQSIREGSLASDSGLKENDVVTHIDGLATRYMPLNKVIQLVEVSKEEKIVFTIRRSALLVRG